MRLPLTTLSELTDRPVQKHLVSSLSLSEWCLNNKLDDVLERRTTDSSLIPAIFHRYTCTRRLLKGESPWLSETSVQLGQGSMHALTRRRGNMAITTAKVQTLGHGMGETSRFNGQIQTRKLEGREETVNTKKQLGGNSRF